MLNLRKPWAKLLPALRQQLLGPLIKYAVSQYQILLFFFLAQPCSRSERGGLSDRRTRTTLDTRGTSDSHVRPIPQKPLFHIHKRGSVQKQQVKHST